MSMSAEVVLQLIFVTGILLSGVLGKLANEEATPREGAIASFWVLEPGQLTERGKEVRRWFLRVMLVNTLVFFSWLAIYH